jgi:hypothetical protein
MVRFIPFSLVSYLSGWSILKNESREGSVKQVLDSNRVIGKYLGLDNFRASSMLALH